MPLDGTRPRCHCEQGSAQALPSGSFSPVEAGMTVNNLTNMSRCPLYVRPFLSTGDPTVNTPEFLHVMTIVICAIMKHLRGFSGASQRAFQGRGVGPGGGHSMWLGGAGPNGRASRAGLEIHPRAAGSW